MAGKEAWPPMDHSDMKDRNSPNQCVLEGIKVIHYNLRKVSLDENAALNPRQNLQVTL